VDETSWQLREALAATHPSAVARSLGGDAALDARARTLRAQLLPCAAPDVLKTLVRLDVEDAWALRDALEAAHADAVVSSLAGVGSSRAWEMRRRWLASRESALGESYASALSAAKSVQGLGDEDAWRLRDAAKRAAPLASLSSLAGLSCERSFSEREHYLQRAPKIVMNTLTSLSDPRAYRMRRTVAMDSKEALDSITGLADDEAWELREAYSDVWPSTVVKTLGPLADTERGTKLLTRQLAVHGNNVSLLKHAASIALGAHRSSHLED
jgi:dTMP kinase